MRVWSIHPKYLDPRGLVALWRETLLARAVLKGETKGYRNHPQLLRFQQQADPVGTVERYLQRVYVEAVERGYRFDARKVQVEPLSDIALMTVTKGSSRMNGRICYASCPRAHLRCMNNGRE